MYFPPFWNKVHSWYKNYGHSKIVVEFAFTRKKLTQTSVWNTTPAMHAKTEQDFSQEFFVLKSQYMPLSH